MPGAPWKYEDPLKPPPGFYVCSHASCGYRHKQPFQATAVWRGDQQMDSRKPLFLVGLAAGSRRLVAKPWMQLIYVKSQIAITMVKRFCKTTVHNVFWKLEIYNFIVITLEEGNLVCILFGDNSHLCIRCLCDSSPWISCELDFLHSPGKIFPEANMCHNI